MNEGPSDGFLFCSYCKTSGHVIQNCKHPKCRVSKNEGNPSSPSKPVLSVSVSEEEDTFEPFKSKGFLSLSQSSASFPINILRYTGTAMSVFYDSAVPGIEMTYTGEKVIVVALGSRQSCQVVKLYLRSPLHTGYRKVALTDTPLDIHNIQLLIGNEVAGSQVFPPPFVVEEPVEPTKNDHPDVYPVFAVTRAQAAKGKDSLLPRVSEPSENLYTKVISKEELIEAQQSDEALASLRHIVTDDHLTKTPFFCSKEGVAMRVYRPAHLLPTDTRANTYQVVVPQSV